MSLTLCLLSFASIISSLDDLNAHGLHKTKIEMYNRTNTAQGTCIPMLFEILVFEETFYPFYTSVSPFSEVTSPFSAMET